MKDHNQTFAVVVTVASASYVAAAQTLGDSVASHCPGVRFVIGLIDRLPPGTSVGYETISIDRIFPDGIEDLLMRSGVFGVAMAGKSAALRAVMEMWPDVELAIYVDSDCWVTGDFVSVVQEHSGKILLTPHSVEPAPSFDVAKRLMRYGQFNAGFVAVRRSSEAIRFLDWWGRMTSTECSSSFLAGSYVDQGYLDLVPLAFPSTQIIRNTGVNAGYWTSGFDRIRRDRESWCMPDGQVLSLCHLSGYSLKEPARLTKFLPIDSDDGHMGLQELLACYRTALSAHSASDSLRGWLEDEEMRVLSSRRRETGLLTRMRHSIATTLERAGWKLVLRTQARSGK